MDNQALLDAITQRLDEKIDGLREDTKSLIAQIKDHEIRLVKMESTAGLIKVTLVTALGGVTSLLGYLVYKVIDIWTQKS